MSSYLNMAMKRRLSDYLQLNNVTVSKDNSVPLYKTQKISFRLFQQKETPHMKTTYPFLTKAQINAKIRQLWKNMEDHEKKNFSKVILTKTPTKSEKIAMKNRTRKCVKGDKQNSIWKEFQTEQSPVYKSDFNSPQNSEQRKSSPSWLKGSPGSLSHVTKDYSKVKFQPDYVVPEVIDDTPNIQPGILRQRENDKPEEIFSDKKKNRVSFSPKRTENSSPITNSAAENSPGYSSEEDCTLIRRDSKDICDFDEIENFSMCIESNDPTHLKQKNDVNDDVQDASENVDKNSEMSNAISTKSENKSDCETVKEKRKSSKGKKKRPIVKEKKIKPDIPLTRITRSTPVSGKTRSEIKENTTPLLLKPQNDQYDATKSDKEKYTTPMMDDATMKQLIEQAKKAPKKRELGRHKSLKEEDDDKELFKKPRARTSLISAQREDNEETSIVDESGDAKMIADEIKESNFEKEDKDLDLEMNLSNTNLSDDYISEGSEIMMMDGNFPTFPSKEPYFKLPDEQNVHLSESEDDSIFEAWKTTSNNTVLETLKRMKEATTVKWHSPVNSPTASPKILSPALSGISQLSSASSESLCSQAAPDTEERDEITDEKDNKAHKRTENATETNEKHDISESDIEDNKSPKSNNGTLKKNTGSKVKVPDDAEEQGDLLSDCQFKEINNNKIGNSVMMTKIEKIRKITSFANRMSPTEALMRKDKPLCELFHDLTPPEQKQLKSSNRRLVASAVTPGKSNFSSLFDTCSESIF